MSQYPYPVETLKHWYVTIVGGKSAELKPGHIGVKKEALAENTDIVPYEDKVLLSRLENNKIQPLFTKKYFTVVPLDENSPDASSKSPMGEVVLPLQEKKSEQFKVGDAVILNNVMSQRLSGLARTMDLLIKKRSGLCIEYGDN